jgi:hypothetical protein
MSIDTNDQTVGPVDFVVVEFPEGSGSFGGAMARELASLVDAEMIRVLDLLVLEKAEDGTVDGFEVEDLGDLGDMRTLAGQLAEILALEDIEHLAAAMEPGSRAGVLVWENVWAAPFAVAVRESGGQLIADGRIPTQALIAAAEAQIPEGD